MESKISLKDREVLRKLATEYAEAAALPVQHETRELWKACNDLHPVRPMVYLYQVCWHEMNVDDELTCVCEDDFARNLENQLRIKLYQWRHMRADMVLDNLLYCPMAVSVTPVLSVKEETLREADEGIQSHHYEPQITCEADIEKINIPTVTHDVELSAAWLGLYNDLFSDIIKVEQRGPSGFRLSIWDRLVEWTGVQEIMMDLVLRPDYVHQAVQRTFDAYNSIVDQYLELGVVAAYNNDGCTSDGALGYTDQLPKGAEEPLLNLWGGAADQIFGEVSPEMHEEFALKYNYNWHKRFGLNYYGCCEPLHNKLEVLRKNIPNLRKVSASPWADVQLTADQCGNELVVSIKPNPAILAEDTFSLDRARAYLTERIAPAKDCAVEIVLKDISTVRHDPKRLWDWAAMAVEVALEAAK
jgi:hypothetical protein